MENQKQQLIDLMKSSNNVLVAVSNDPSVDQLSAAIGFSLLLNKQGKHATAVFSGAIPSTIEFLQPEKTLERNTDSLRDFIISLDKSKADVIRYKVEGDHVKIFITPYRTSISQQDLDFSQGDFNVDVVVALGVMEQKDIDRAITAHGRILHGASVVTVNHEPGSSLGSVNWTDATASSLCEMLASVVDDLAPNSLDAQMATAFLTGIVAETARFSNEKTTSQAMSISARLMGAGANQQLIANELQKAAEPTEIEEPKLQVEGATDEVAEAEPEEPKKPDDGSLQISHIEQEQSDDQHELSVRQEEQQTMQPPMMELPPLVDQEVDDQEETDEVFKQIHIDEQGQFLPLDEPKTQDEAQPTSGVTGGNPLILEPPSLGGTLTANSRPEDAMLTGTTDPLSQQSSADTHQLLSHDAPMLTQLPADPVVETDVADVPATPEVEAIDPVEELPPSPQTLADLEEAVDSPHIQPEAPEPPINLNEARDAVMDAVAAVNNQPLPPIAALNAKPLDMDVQQSGADVQPATPPEPIVEQPTVVDSTAPPPVPPPMMPSFGHVDDPYATGINEQNSPPSNT